MRVMSKNCEKSKYQRTIILNGPFGKTQNDVGGGGGEGERRLDDRCVPKDTAFEGIEGVEIIITWSSNYPVYRVTLVVPFFFQSPNSATFGSRCRVAEGPPHTPTPTTSRDVTYA